MEKSNFRPYDPGELSIIINEPWEVRDRPFMLHAAYAISCLYDLLANEDDEEEGGGVNEIWGSRVPQKMVDRLVQDAAADFNDAADQKKPIRIFGKPYLVRKANAYDHQRLRWIFDFKSENGEYIINKEGILNLSLPWGLKEQVMTSEQSRRNREYFRQIVKLAEDDEHDGWDKLTDMEVLAFCWGLYFYKHQDENEVVFRKLFKDHIYVDWQKDAVPCFNEKSRIRMRPVGMYPFSREKITEWNEAHGQHSEAAKIPQQEADDYWYDVALKHTFKPKA